MGGIGSWEILLILLFGLIIFGSKRIPEIAKGLGKGLSEFKRAARDIQDELSREIERDLNPKDTTNQLPPPATPELTTPDPPPKTTDPGADPDSAEADPGVDPYSTEANPASDAADGDSGSTAGDGPEDAPSPD
jgi:TatA/E family protein of Tat protein translocase